MTFEKEVQKMFFESIALSNQQIQKELKIRTKVCPKCAGSGKLIRSIIVLMFRKTAIVICDQCQGYGKVK